MNKLKLFIPLILLCLPALAQQSESPEQFIVDRFIDETGREVVKIVVPGKPPDGYRMPVAEPTDASYTLANVPGYDWSFGCSATSAAMMAGYYDRTGYANMYSGPTNGGVAPMDNSVWGTVTINGEVRSQCPFSATRNGLDGRTIRGHVDDYWVIYGHTGPDPYITNGWTQHTYGDCTGDYMKTNQSVYNNSDGSTWFYNYTNGSPYSGTGNNNDDGMYGIKLFFESRGYTVLSHYNQYIYGHNGNTLGFTFAQFKQEIDAGRPVLIQVTGHTMLGYGYNDTGSLVYLRDTWDYSSHSMTWGGSYSGMTHYAVGVISLAPVTADPCSSVIAINGCGSAYARTYTGGGSGSWYTASSNPCGYATPGVEQVYSFVAPTTGTYSIQVTAASGYVDYLWKASSCSSSGWNCIDDIATTGQYGSMSWTAGTTYYLLLDDENSTTGTHTFYINCPVICVDCPTYDFSLSPSTGWSTHASSHVAYGCKIYRISVTSGRTYTFKTGCGDGATATYDTYLTLFNSSCSSLLTDDDACESLRSKITWTATYSGYAYLKVSGYSNGFGNYTLAHIYTTPQISVSATSLAFGNVQVNTNSSPQSYTVSGTNLNGNLSITAPAGFQVSLSSGSGYGSSLSLTPSSGTVPTTTIYARFNPTAIQGYSGNIAHSSSGATTVNVAVSGTGTGVQLPVSRTVQNITVSSGQAACYDATQTITVAGGGTTFILQNGGDATFIAGQNILFMPGTMIQQGGDMLAYITTNGLYCGALQSSVVSTEPPEIEEDSDPTLFSLEKDFKLYPNPTNGMFTLEFEEGSECQDCIVYIFSMNGNRVHAEELHATCKHIFDLSAQQRGIYVVQIIRGDRSDSERMIRQ